MGSFLNTIIRFLGGKREDEEGERPFPVHPRRWYNGDYMPKILSIHKLLYNIFQKMRIIIFQRKRPAEPILPVKIAAPEENESSHTISAIEEIIESAVSIEPQNVHCLSVYKKEVIIESSVVVDEERIMWIKHYNNRHRILIVGDGDFSFSASLAMAFGCASNIIATSLDSQAFLEKHYRKFMSNIKELKSRGCNVMHEIDATKMASHEILGHLTFDRIIYNFPFAGFFKDLSREAQLRELVNQFMKNAKEMLSENGEIHTSHKTNGFHKEWNLEYVASSHGLRLIQAVDFNHLDYPGYNTKCGFGGDNNFNCYPSKTYKFGPQMTRY